MSMISAQIDELRELAGDGSMEWVTGPIRASVLRDAADTIWELRDDLQRANAENAKLRKLCIDFASMLSYAGLDGLVVEAHIGGASKTYDASVLCDMAEKLWDDVDG